MGWTPGESAVADLGFLDVRDFGADPTGNFDSGPAILAAVQAAWSIPAVPKTVYVPCGAYKITTPVDLSTLVLTQDLFGWSFICDPGVTFEGEQASGNTLNLALPNNHQVEQGTLRLGRVVGPGSGTANGINLVGWNNCQITISEISQYVGGVGLLIPASSVLGTFNNLIDIGAIQFCTVGLFSVGTANPGVWGFQANIVKIGLVIHCSGEGVLIDNAVNSNSQWNRFLIGCLQNNGAAIIDNNGGNWWEVSNTNTNPSAGQTFNGFILGSGAVNVPTVRGFFTDGTNLHSQKADMVNYSTFIGNVAAPGIPSSGTDQTNTYDRPARVYVAGGTVSAIAIDGAATGLTSGYFRLIPGETIRLTYSVAPSWKWYLE